jgi:hypothetical protein
VTKATLEVHGVGAVKDKFYTNEFSDHIIYGCDYGSDNNGGAGKQNGHRIPNYDYDGDLDFYNNALNGILYQYCYKPYTNPNRTDMQLSELYGESKQNLMDVQFNSKIGSIGGISKGKIPVFRSNKNISITKILTPVIINYPVPQEYIKAGYQATTTTNYIRTARGEIKHYHKNTYNLKYNNNTVATTNADFFTNYSGTGTTITNSDIESIQIKGNNYGTVFNYMTDKTDSNVIFVYNFGFNYTNKQSDIIIPSASNISKKITFNNNIQPINVDIPFTIDPNILLDNMLFDFGNKNLVFYPNGFQYIKLNSIYNGTYNINYYNRRFEPIVTIDYDLRAFIEKYPIKCVREPYFDTNTEILKYNATPNFALIYYPFTIEPLNIPSNVTTLIIDGGVSSVPTINLPSSAPVGYQLNIQNDSFKLITTNKVARYVTMQVNIAITINEIGIASFTSTRSNITFTYRSDSNGRYWSMV